MSYNTKLVLVFIVSFFITFFVGHLASSSGNRHHQPDPHVRHMWCFTAPLDHVIVNICEPTQVECNLRRAQVGAAAGECAPRAVPQ